MPTARPLAQHTRSVPGAVSCPRCRGPLDRVPRHFVDRLLSRIASVHRYRCQRFDCQWEGLLRPPRSARRG